MNGPRLHPWLFNKQYLLISIFIGFCSLVIYSCFNVYGSGEKNLSYIEDVQPILAAKCYACHGPDAAKREAGLRLDVEEALFDTLESGISAIDLNDLDQSELIRRITSDDPDEQMPPPNSPKPLESEEIHILQNWVKQGATWENHWSFEPLKVIEPPSISNNKWSQHPIDRFVFQKHKELGLRHSKEADKRTLIRRLYIDLHGLPPSPEDVEAFVKDDSENAYENLVDSLLASPRYGERWARHWLDVVHYGETHGYDKDQRRPHAWPYRDYVIHALNSDIPYYRFIEDQLAGDMLHPNDPNSIKALGFLAAGPWDLVGHVEVKDGTVDKRIIRNLDRDDMVSNVMASFTGLTVQCARCHDHKFDPIRQADYYSLQAVFAGIDRADRPYHDDPVIHEKRITLSTRVKHSKKKRQEFLEKLSPKEIKRVKQLIGQQNKQQAKIHELRYPRAKDLGYHSAIEEDPLRTKVIELDLGASFPIEKIVLHPSFVGKDIVMPGAGFPIKFKLEASKEKTFEEAHLLVDFSKNGHAIRTDKAYHLPVDHVPARYVRLTANELWKGVENDHFLAMAEVQVFSQGKNRARKARVKVTDAWAQEKWDPQFLIDGFDRWRYLRNEAPSSKQLQKVELQEKVLTKLKNQEVHIRRKGLSPSDQKLFDQVQKDLARDEAALKKLPEPSYVYAAANDFPAQFRFAPADSIRPIFRLNRGDPEQALEEVGPGTVKTFDGLPDRFDIYEGHTEGDRRAALTGWMVDERNAFTWRSIVNRVWHYHFGQGIVATPNDFGKMGTPPSHPELLAYLAQEFLKHGQSLKWLHRFIVTSATYKQASSHQVKNHTIDGFNRYLWRANRRQLEAEAVWDGVLAISGKLDLTMGGPSFDAFRYEDDHSPRYVYSDYNVHDPHSFRRAIYRSIVRSVPDPFMTTLDCADPSQSVPVRNETITALQALSALNNPFMVRQAAFLAERLEQETDGLEAQVRRGILLTLLREAKPNELKELTNYASIHGLAAACRLLFGMNEFLYVD